MRKELPELTEFLSNIPNWRRRINYQAAINLPNWFPKDGSLDAYTVYEVILKSGTLNDPFNGAWDEPHWEEGLVALLASSPGMKDEQKWKENFDKVLEQLCAATTTAHTDRTQHYHKLANDYPKVVETMEMAWPSGIPEETLGE